MSIVIRESAAEDIELLTHLFQTRSATTALKFIRKLDRAIRLLERLPLSGSELGLFSDGVPLRFQVVPSFRNYLILHSPLPDGVEIHRVIDGRQDLASLLAQ